MKYFALKFNLNSELSQPEVMDKLKSKGFEVIQSSSGFYVKGRNQPPLQDLGDVGLETLKRDEILSDPETPSDLLAFLK